MQIIYNLSSMSSFHIRIEQHTDSNAKISQVAMCNVSGHRTKYPKTAKSSLSALQLQVTDPLSSAIFLAHSDARGLVLLLLASYLSPALLVVLMPLDHKPGTRTRICGCSRYCKWPRPVLHATYYRHERYREYDRRESSSF